MLPEPWHGEAETTRELSRGVCVFPYTCAHRTRHTEIVSIHGKVYWIEDNSEQRKQVRSLYTAPWSRAPRLDLEQCQGLGKGAMSKGIRRWQNYTAEWSNLL